MDRSRLLARLPVTRRKAVLAVGDLAMIALFVALGEIRHGGTAAAWGATVVEFGVGWVVVAIPVGVYTDRWTATRPHAVGSSIGAWVVAVVLAQAIRIATGASGAVSVEFVVVSIGFGGVLIGAWRAVWVGRGRRD